MKNSEFPTLSALRGVVIAVAALACAGTWAAGASQPAVMIAQAPVQINPHQPARASDPAEMLPEVELTPQLLFRVLASEIAVQRGDIASAALTYLGLARETRDPRFARRATELGVAARSPTALEAGRLWHELAPGSEQAAQAFESLLLIDGEVAEAEPLLASRLVKARAAGTLKEFYAQLRRNLPAVRDPGAALAMVQRLTAQDLELAEARLTIAAVAHAAKKPELAESEAVAALRMQPEDRATLLATLVYSGPGKEGAERARQRLADFLDRHPDDAELWFIHAQALAADGQIERARDEFERAMKLEPDNPRVLLTVAQFSYRNKDLDRAEQLLKRYLELPGQIRNPDPARMMLGLIAEDKDNPEQALRWYEQVQPGEQFISAVGRRAMLTAKMARLGEALEMLHSVATTTSAERVRLLTIESDILRELGQQEAAFKVLDDALLKYRDDHDLLYAQAMAAERINRIDAMEKSLRHLITLDPKNANAYNALGYSLADRNLRLGEAQKLIEQALQLQPESAHIIDSMGWVMFRRGQIEAALRHLIKAYGLAPETDIAAHLGEVLWVSGRKEEARTIWRAALRDNADNQILIETLKRLGATL